MTRVATSWTGSERQRRPQGTCSAPVHRGSEQARFVIPRYTNVQILSLTGFNRDWREYRTQRELAFERYDSRNKPKRFYEFREQGFLIRVRNDDIEFRAENRFD